MKDKSTQNYAKAIADAALDIGAIKLNSKEPFTWASKYRMPIYNDNRLHLAYPQNRKLINSAFLEIIQSEDINFNLITGTMTAGIAPAASLAYATDMPMAILDGNKVHYFSTGFLDLFVEPVHNNCDVIVSTCPTSIVPAVFAANGNNLPFAYVRPKKKDHGLEQQIEGLVKEGQRAALIDFYTGKSYVGKAIEALEKEGLEVKHVISEEFEGLVKHGIKSPKGKNVLHIEDLVSTGGSCVDEIQTLRKMGAQITDCLAIFSYDFPETLDKFRTAACRIHPALTYNQLLEAALERDAIAKEDVEMLSEWSGAPFEWGAKHGFPKVETK